VPYNNWAIVSVLLQMDLLKQIQKFFGDLTVNRWSTIICEDISDHIKYVDPVTREYAKDVQFANDQWTQLEYLLTAPVPLDMINTTSIGNLAYMAQVHGENSQWMQLYNKILSELRGQ
jgi:hypothetical protein